MNAKIYPVFWAAVLCLSAMAQIVWCEIIYVPADYPTIQLAIDAAADTGDEIIVAPGTYDEAVNLNGKAIYLHSSDGAEVTTIDAAWLYKSVISCKSGEGPDTIIEGFTITGGNGTFDIGSTYGGGMYNLNSSPTIINCVFRNNYLSNGSGGGMLNKNADPLIIDCEFINNFANSAGGAICNFSNSLPVISGCTFIENSTEYSGGAIYNGGSVVSISDCTFDRNYTLIGRGGAIAGEGDRGDKDSHIILFNCIFTDNRSNSSGGGITLDYSTMYAESCKFIRNTTSFTGGGVETGSLSIVYLYNCGFFNNVAGQSDRGGGGVYVGYSNDQIYIWNSTFVGNDGGSNYGGALEIHEEDSTTIVGNSIFWDNAGFQIYNEGGGTLEVTYSDIQGGFTGEGNINEDPLFLDPQNDDFRLSAGSPCIDAGDTPSILRFSQTDLYGNPRIMDDPNTPDTGIGAKTKFGKIYNVDLGIHEFAGDIPTGLLFLYNPHTGITPLSAENIDG